MGHAITPEQKSIEAQRLEALMASEAGIEEPEEVVNLSFEQVWDEFKERKFAYRRAHRKNPTAVMLGQVEMGVFQQNLARLKRKELVKQVGKRLWLMNMMVIATEAESMIMPMHSEMGQLDLSPWLKFLKGA